jgi:uncharacterized protein (DUF2336 family)
MVNASLTIGRDSRRDPFEEVHSVPVSFAAWCETVSVTERCEALELFAHTLFDARSGRAEIENCEAALLMLARDPSSRVRAALSARIAGEPTAPRPVVQLLAGDVDSVALPLVRQSRLLGEDDLADLAVTGSLAVRTALAGRRRLGARIAAILAADDETVVVAELLSNPSAIIASATLARIADDRGDDAEIRELLLRREDLPASLRHTLMLRAGEALASMDLMRGLLGTSASTRICAEACEAATGTLAADLAPEALADFVAHLRASGQVTTAFLLRAACTGNVDVFAACVAHLCDRPYRRVRAVLVEASDPAFGALCASAGIPAAARPLLLDAVRAWKDVARRGEARGARTTLDVLDRLTGSIGTGALADELRTLVVRLGAQARRQYAGEREPLRLAA